MTALYIEMESKKGQKHEVQEEINKTNNKKFTSTTTKKVILIGIVNIAMWMGTEMRRDRNFI